MSEDQEHQSDPAAGRPGGTAPRGVPEGVWSRIAGARTGEGARAMGLWTDEATDNLVVVCAAPAPEILALASGWVGVQPEPHAGRILVRFQPARPRGPIARAGYRLCYRMDDEGHRELWERALAQRYLDTLWLRAPRGELLVRDVLDLEPVSSALDSALGA